MFSVYFSDLSKTFLISWLVLVKNEIKNTQNIWKYHFQKDVCAYQLVRNISFPKNSVDVLNERATLGALSRNEWLLKLSLELWITVDLREENLWAENLHICVEKMLDEVFKLRR